MAVDTQWERFAIGMVALLCAAAAFWMACLGAGFPLAYHNDEFSKTEQIRIDWRNLRHPPLMLTLAESAAHVFGVPPEDQALAELGRRLSAVAVGLAAGFAAVLGGLWGGRIGALIVGAGVATQPLLIECGHYFKEDSFFAACFAGFWLALAWWERRPGAARAAVVGVAVGLCGGMRYAGWIVLPLALTAILATWWADARRHRSRAGHAPPDARRVGGARGGGAGAQAVALALAMLATSAWAYAPAFTHGARIIREVGLELSLLSTGEGFAGLTVPHAEYLNRLIEAYSPGLPMLAGLALVTVWLRRDRTAAMVACVLFAPAWVAALAWIPKYSDRYLLPALILLPVLLLLALDDPARPADGQRRHRTMPRAAALAGGLAFLLAMHGLSLVPLLTGFHTDDRLALVRFAAAELPHDARIACDAMVLASLLAGEGGPEFVEPGPEDVPRIRSASKPNPPRSERFAADLGSLDQLRARGITHVAVCWHQCHRYIDRNYASGVPGDALVGHRRAFYNGLFDRHPLIWQAPNAPPATLRPGLFLFHIAGWPDTPARPGHAAGHPPARAR